MPYIVKEKLDLRDFAAADGSRRLVLMAAVEQNLVSVYRRHLEAYNLSVQWSQHLHEAARHIDFFSPDMVVAALQSGKGFPGALRALKSMREYSPSLPLLSLGFSLQQRELEDLMEIGVTSHINREFTRPADVVVIIKHMLISQPHPYV